MNQLKTARESRNISQQSLADLAGTTRQTIIRLERGDQKLTTEWAERLALHLGCESFQLLFSDEDLRAIAAQHRNIPVKGEVQAGVWREIDDVDEDRYPPIPMQPDPRFARLNQFALLVRGESMNLVFPDGQFIVCVGYAELGTDLSDGDLVVVERRRGAARETTVKRLRVIDGAPQFLPESNDPRFQVPIDPQHPDGDTEVAVVAVVIGRYEPLR